MSSPVYTHAWLRIVSLLFPCLFALQTKAETLQVDRTVLAVGESVTVRIPSALGLLKPKWRASPEGIVLFTDKGRTEATVKGLAPGRVEVTARIDWKLDSTTYQVSLCVKSVTEPSACGEAEAKEPDWGHSGPELQRLSYDQRRMADLLRKANLALAQGEAPEAVARRFYSDLAKLNLSEPLVKLNALKTELSKLGLVDAALGERFDAGGTPVERALLVYRRDLTLASIRAAIAEVGRRYGPDTGTVFLAKIGKWAVQQPDQFVFAGDIDFSFVGARPEVILALRDAYAREIKARSGGLDMVAIDSLATAHGYAEHYVYVGIQGRKFADDAMRVMDTGVERIDFNDPSSAGTERAQNVHGERALREVVIEETALRYAREGHEERSRRLLDEIDRAWNDRSRQTVEPFLSMEMARHLDKDIIQKADVFTAIDIIKKGAKYLRRSNDQSRGDLRIALPDAALAKFVESVDEMAKDKKLKADDLVKFIDAELGKLGFTGFEVQFINGKATLQATPDGIERFLARVKQTIWNNVSIGMDARIRALSEAINNRGAAAGPDTPDDMRPERLADTLRMMADGLQVMKDEQAAIPPEIITKASILAKLVQSYGGQRGYALPTEEIEKIKKLLQESVANERTLLLNVGTVVSHIDQWLVKNYDRLSAKLPAGQKLTIAEAKIDALNSLLDALDSTLLDTLRNKGVLELDMGMGADGRPRVHATTFPRIAAINQRLNESVLGRIGNNIAFKTFNLAQEGEAYYSAIMQANTPSEAFSNLATEIFRRRVPGGGAVEAYVMENYARMGIEVVYTIFPPAAVPEGLYGMGSALYDWGRQAWWHGNLETLIDSLYEQAEFGQDSARPGYYPLTHVTYKNVRYSRKGLEEGKSFILDPDVDKTLSENLRASDPFLSLMAELEKHSAAGEKVRASFRAKADKRWVELKREFVHHMIERLERRHAAEVADLTGQIPGIYAELLDILERLEIRERVLKQMDAEWDSSNLKAFWTWLKNLARQGAWGGTLAETERNKAASIVIRYRDAYRDVLATRTRLEADIARILSENGVAHPGVTQHKQRLLTGIVFLTGEADRDRQTAEAWASIPNRIEKQVRDELTSIKTTHLPGATLDTPFDRNTLGQVFFEDIWIKALRSMQVPVISAASFQRAADARKQHRAELIKAFKAHYAKLAVESGDQTKDVSKTDKPLVQGGAGERNDADAQTEPGGPAIGKGVNGPTPAQTGTRTPTDLSRATCSNPTGIFTKEPFNGLQLRYGISGLCIGPNKDVAGFTQSRSFEILGITGSTITVSGSSAPRVAICHSWAGSFWFQTDVSLTVGDKTVTYSSPKPCERKSETSYSVTQPAYSFNLSLPVPQDKAEVAVSVSIRQTFVNPRFGNRDVVVSGSGYHVRPVVGSFPEGGEDGTPPPPALQVSLDGPRDAVKFGQPLSWSAKTEGGKPPYGFRWSGAEGRGASASLTPKKPGEQTIEVTASDSAGQTAQDSLKIRVEAPKLTLNGLPMQPVYGSQARLSVSGLPDVGPAADPCVGRDYTGHSPFDECVRVRNVQSVSTTSPSGTPTPAITASAPLIPASGVAASGRLRYRFVWQSSPGLTFEPSTSADGATTVTFDRIGQVKVWCEVQVEDQGAWVTLGETDQQTLDVVAPAFTLRFSPPDGQGRIGQEVRARIVSNPAVPEKLIDYRWIEPQSRREYSHNASEAGFKVKDDKPMPIEVLARVPHYGDEIAKITGTYTGIAYAVKIGEPKGYGPPLQVWVCDTQLGHAQNCGMKDIPRGQFATFQDIFLKAEVTPVPPSPRYRWTVDPPGSCGLPRAGSELKLNCSNTGSYTVKLQVFDKDDLLLGQAERTLVISIDGNDVKQAPKSKEAFEKLQLAKQQAGNGQLDEAIANASSAAGLDPKNAEAKALSTRWKNERDTLRQQIDRARQALQANKLDEAERVVEAARRLHPKYPPLVELDRQIADKRRTSGTAGTGMAGSGGIIGATMTAGIPSVTGIDAAGTLIVAGKWRTSEGELTMLQSGRSVTGSYTTDGGEIVGELNGNVLEGYWIENGSAERCATAKNGRYYWGRIRWSFQGDRFTGNWSYCDRPVASDKGWTGERISSAPSGPGLPGDVPRIVEFVWQGMEEDRVGILGEGKPNGTKDGHFQLTLEAPGRYVLAALSLWSANDKGEKVGGQVWHTRNGNYWLLGVFRDGRQLNASHVARLGEFSGRVQLDLYANSSGWFNPGQWFLLELETADGKVVRQTLRLGDAPQSSSSAGHVNLARGKPASQSSTSVWSRANDAQGAVDGIINGGYGFHTNNEANPWWQVDLGGQASIEEVRIFNRLDCCAERTRTLQIMLSDDARHWRTVYRHGGGIFGGKDGKPLKVALGGASARYVRLQLNEANWLHLDEVEVYGRMGDINRLPGGRDYTGAGSPSVTPHSRSGTGYLRIEACVDGSDWIGIANGRLVHQHRAYAQIGTHGDCPPTHQVPGGGFLVDGLPVGLARLPMPVGMAGIGRFEVERGRGQVRADGANRILIDDDGPGGPDVYVIRLYPGDVGITTPVATVPGGRDYTAGPVKVQPIFEVGNIGAVGNGPTKATRFTLSTPHFITLIRNYHWNGARGATPGTIALKAQDGTTYGPWQATGSPGQGGVPNAYWTVYPHITLPAGTYTVIDSDPGSWSHNAQSDNRGFVRIEGYPAEASHPANTPSPNNTEVDSLMKDVDELLDTLKSIKGLFGK